MPSVRRTTQPVCKICNTCNKQHLGNCGPLDYTAVEGLTHRENQVLFLICQGYTSPDIAKHLNINYETVKLHITSIFDKTGMANRLELGLKFANLQTSKTIDILEKKVTDLDKQNKRLKAELARERTIVAALITKQDDSKHIN